MQVHRLGGAHGAGRLRGGEGGEGEEEEEEGDHGLAVGVDISMTTALVEVAGRS